MSVMTISVHLDLSLYSSLRSTSSDLLIVPRTKPGEAAFSSFFAPHIWKELDKCETAETEL